MIMVLMKGDIMNTVLGNIGLFAIFCSVIYIYKKILEYYDIKRLGLYEDEKIYKTAEKFSHGISSEKIKSYLSECNHFNKEDAEKVLLESSSHRIDKDGGYRIFIKSVNKVLGENVYDEKYHIHE